MTEDHPSPTDPASRDEDPRTSEARRVAEEYAAGLREMLRRLRKLFVDHA
jgi:hypothetical protein